MPRCWEESLKLTGSAGKQLHPVGLYSVLLVPGECLTCPRLITVSGSDLKFYGQNFMDELGAEGVGSTLGFDQQIEDTGFENNYQ